ncbi:NAD-dependent epimerase/dehydratase family protein [Actinomadura flavalba]|uniref:NAD-dependent epimerase/dehydratase family protein n=1 Tax=Actinomadura flavalba TaxID=1120938 RepID=UPI00036F34C4|nr:NAD-dependent epimerase/dehydratase family protein [Actinomadura flavalba]
MVAVTGAADGAGRLLAARLAENPAIGTVVAIDARRGDVADVVWRVADVRDPLLSTRLANVDVIVHLDVLQSPDLDARERRAHNVRGAQTVVLAAAATRVRRVVLVTSAMVYGAVEGNPLPLPEDAPIAAEPSDSIAGDFLEIEDLAATAPAVHPGLDVTVVRPAALVGPGVDTVITRHFEAPRLLSVKGAETGWQFCALDDLVSALDVVVTEGLPGPVAVGCDGWLSTARVAELAGKRTLELPAALTFGTAQRLHRLGMTPAPATDLHYVAYPWVVDCAALRTAGWRPAHDNADVLAALMDETSGRHAVVGRRVGGREATMATAAGATVAALGAAAAIRRARRRRRP